jgi:hypothetical protein
MIFTSATAIQARLFVRSEGAGRLLYSVPIGQRGLAQILVEPGIQGYDNLGVTNPRLKRIIFQMKPEFIPYTEDIRALPTHVLARDQVGLRELLLRIVLDPVAANEINVLLREEFDYLLYHLNEGPWIKGIPYIL